MVCIIIYFDKVHMHDHRHAYLSNSLRYAVITHRISLQPLQVSPTLGAQNAKKGFYNPDCKELCPDKCYSSWKVWSVVTWSPDNGVTITHNVGNFVGN